MTTSPKQPHSTKTAMESPASQEPAHPCAFVGQGGTACAEQALQPGGFCFWHDPHAPKTGPEIKTQLAALAHAGRSLEGFNLRGADLRAINLTHRQRGKSVDLRNADLSRANLQDAHLFHIDLRGSTLLKSDLRAANLNYAQMDGSNLLGADLRDARLERIDWGRHLMQEYAARRMQRAGRSFEAHQLWGEAEEASREISLALQERGHSNLAGRFYVKQMVMRRMQMPRWSRDRFFSWFVDVICGYGERADRVITFALFVILFNAGFFFLFGVQSADGRVGFELDRGLRENVLSLLACTYFSVVTFTTTGYGDLLPTGWMRALAVLEAFTGVFSTSLFVVVFVKRMTR